MLVKYKDYYQTLGVPRNAADKDIKASYRKLARQYHPDQNKGDKASEEKFKELSEAYEVLKDPEKRRRYDQLGSNWKSGDQFRPPPDYSGFQFDFGDMSGFGKGSPFSDFFESVFGQSFGAGGTVSQGQRPGAQGAASAAAHRGQRPGAASSGRSPLDQEAEIELTLEEVAKGTTRTLQISGQGVKSKTLEVKIPPGVRQGSKIRVPGEGAKSPVSAQAGDLYLKVKVKAHAEFSIEGDNLICTVNLTPAQAVIGSEASVPTLDGPVKIRIPAGTQSGRMLRLKGRGLPKLKESAPGDILVRTKIMIPTELSDREKELYGELLKLENDHNHSK
ncbi:MAG: J domain-containing protein [Leptolyngbya sp.]|nr:J domain-containing protein [Candidatus Melainabacteria bacterium]